MSENFKIEIVSIDKELSLNSTIPSSTKNFSSSDPENILIIPGFKKDIIEIWSFKIPISPSKAGTTTSDTLSFDKKDFSGFTISILKFSLIKQQLP